MPLWGIMMNRNRMLMVAVTALCLSAVVTFLFYRLIQRRLHPTEQTVSVVVAADKLSLGMRLEEKDIHVASWPKSNPVEGSFADPKDVIGRGVIIPMLPNEPILESKLAPREAGAGLTPAIPDGQRAVAVKVNDVIGVAGFVLPGTRVDVIMTGTPKNDGNNDDMASRIILENVQVLAAGQNITQDSNGKPENVQVVTLLVTPEQAQDLAVASENAKIQLALRNPLDQERKDPHAALRTALFYPGHVLPEPKPAPASPPPAPAKKEAPVQQVVVAPPAPPDPCGGSLPGRKKRNHDLQGE